MVPPLSDGGTIFRLRVDGLFDLSLHQPGVDPEAVDAQRDDAAGGTIDASPKIPQPVPMNCKLPALEVRVLGPPPFHQDDGERVADPEA